MEFGETLSELLPKIKTRLQLSGLAIGLAFALFVHFAKPGDNTALITAGAVGISLIIFGQLFNFLKDFAQRDRPKVFLLSFAVFCVFTLALLVLDLRRRQAGHRQAFFFAGIVQDLAFIVEDHGGACTGFVSRPVW